MTSPASEYSEDALVEQPAIELFSELGWDTANLYHETYGPDGTEGRETPREVVLVRRLRAALERLNPDLDRGTLDNAIEQLTEDRSAMLAVNANRAVYKLLKDGVKVTVQDERGNDDTETVRLIDWREPANNDFFLASQLWVTGELYKRRADLVGFVNGIPLAFVELKASHKNLKNAYDGNLSDYRYAIPHLFHFNGLVMLSNGSKTRVGSTFAGWDHFAEWKRINDEGEQGVVSLETAIRGVCDQHRLLDLIENFVVYEEERGGLVKKLAKNHQYLGVNRAIREVGKLGENQGRLGVFWHTQGSGKSLSMVFFSQKIHRTIPGNWTFLIVTDRRELDDQIYRKFTACGVVTEKKAQATGGDHLKQLLNEDHRYIFTLIQKFRTEAGQKYPRLSERDDIIVITDEAHRSQYDIFAANMRRALPNAAFLGFTGTPLMMGEEKTREVFGDYVSVYNFAQSIEDGATVPLYYENRIPELQLINEDLDADLEKLLEAAELDEDQEAKLEREFAREYHLITREDRLEKVAEDIVTHFMGRGHRGKAMVICIDKATAVRMHDKVKAHWAVHLEELKARLKTASEQRAEGLRDKIAEMEALDMAVVVSQSQNEVTELAAKGLDILPHRKRMVNEDLDEKFKDPDDPFRLVFVCAMWITGFDVPSCSTIYLDKPMRNHTLMQTIARANRVAPGKAAGLIVDYVGVFRDLQKALAVYAPPRTGGPGVDQAIKNKQELVDFLREAIDELKQYCAGRGIDLEAIKSTPGLAKIALMDDAVEVLIESEESKKFYLQKASVIARVFRAILPDPIGEDLAPDATVLVVLAEKIRALTPPPDISGIMGEVEKLLDDAIAAEGYVIRTKPEEETQALVDLSQIDWDKLARKFQQGRKRTEAEKLKALIEGKLNDMVRKNRTRMALKDRLQKLVDEYNAGSKNIEEFFQELLRLAQELTQEDQRAIAENLSEEELAVFDILTKPDPKLTKKQEAEVKRVARELVATLKREKLVLDWRKYQRTRADVRRTIETLLDKGLPDIYEEDIYNDKCERTYLHVFDAYVGAGQSVYASAA